jgi:hypothetical protein
MVGEYPERGPSGRLRRWDDNSKMNFIKTGCKDDVSQNKNNTLVNTCHI